MHPEDSLFALFDDLEQQAAGIHLAEREVEVGELAEGEYAQVTLAGRLHAGRGTRVRLRLMDGERLAGQLRRVGVDWLQLDDDRGSSWLVRAGAVTGLTGLGSRALSEEALPVTARLSLRSALRAVAGARRECLFRLVGGDQVEGLVGRVGHDFVEVVALDPATERAAGDTAGFGRGRSSPELVPLAALVSVRERR